jgi:hypothetical protein
MSDTIYQPNATSNPAPPEPSKIDLPISRSQETPRPDRIKEAKKNEHSLRDASRQMTRRREEEAPRVEWDASDIAREDGTVDRRAWERHQTASRNADHGKKVAASIGLDPAQVSDKTRQRLGEMLSSSGRKASEEAKTRIGLTAQDPVTGEIRQRRPIEGRYTAARAMQEGGETSLRGITEEQANFREYQQGLEEARQQNLLAEVRGQLALGATPDQIADPDFVPLERPVQPVQAGQPVQPSAQPQQPRPAQPDPLARERQLLQRQHAEAKRIAEVSNWSAAESAEAQRYHSLNTWLRQQPENDAAALANLQSRVSFGDAAAAQRLQELKNAVNARAQAQARFAELNRGATDRRIALQNERTAQERKDYAKWAAQNDEGYQKALPEVLPQHASKEADLRGVRFGRLRVTARAKATNGSRHAHWFCECLCGAVTGPVRGVDLQIGHTKSCGCARADAMAKTGRTNRKRRTNGF